MNTDTTRWGPPWAALLVFLLVAPPLAAGLTAVRLPPAVAVAAGTALAAILAWWAGRRLGEMVGAALPRRAVLAAPLALASLSLLHPYARLAVYMADATRTECAFFKAGPNWLYHSCFSAYSEADRLAHDASTNIYAAEEYENRSIGRFRVDTYYYPPVFLLQPRAVAAVTGGDFLASRTAWYGLQCVTLAAVALLVAAWLGGPAGGRALLALPLLYSAQPMLAGLQYGNIQVTAVTTSVLGVLLIARSRPALGGALLGLATVSKIFPGLLGVYLLASRRWRGALWTAGWGVLLVAVAWGVLGTKPFADFVYYALPKIHDLSAFPQTEAARTAAVNTGVYGLTVKLRWLGVRALDAETGRRVTDLYGFLLVAITALLGWREHRRPFLLHRPDDRAQALQIWLALVGLASYRSPFVGFAYGGASTMWLLWVMTAAARRPAGVALGVAGFAITAGATALVPPPVPTLPAPWVLVLTAALQVAMFAINGTVVVRALAWRRARSRDDDPVGALAPDWTPLPPSGSREIAS